MENGGGGAAATRVFSSEFSQVSVPIFPRGGCQPWFIVKESEVFDVWIWDSAESGNIF